MVLIIINFIILYRSIIIASETQNTTHNTIANKMLGNVNAADDSNKDESFLEDKKDATELTLPSSTWNKIIHTSNLWGQLKNLKKLELNNNELTTLPACLDALPSLEILFLSENKFETIPECIGRMSKLRMLSFRGNCLKELSSTNLPTSSLVWLILTNNDIGMINPNVKELKLLRKLMLSHNKIPNIPKELGQCTDLELIRLANNDINVPLPNEFLTLPKLAWISLAGNPIAHNPETLKEREILKSSVTVDESRVLGRGASGTVYLGQYNDKDVAVKIFKQQSMGSDGCAADEARINAVVDHPLAVSAHGVFISDDGSPEGMAMELLEGAEALGCVPSFNTVTRDAGPSDTAKDLSKDQVLSVVWNTAIALEHVHSSANVVNGDIYLHNILRTSKDLGTTKMSDWGASFIYDGNDNDSAATFEAIEVLAFGRLVQDLFDWHLATALPDSTEPADFLGRTRGDLLERGPFYDLMTSILQPDQASRPTFATIKAKLSSMPEFQACKQSTEQLEAR